MKTELDFLPPFYNFSLGIQQTFCLQCGILFAMKEKAFEALGTEKAVFVELFTVIVNLLSIQDQVALMSKPTKTRK